MADQITRVRLMEPILDQGMRSTNYFNGRLLTAADLRTDQEAGRQLDAQLGRALGSGVVEGFEIRVLADGSDGQAPVLEVTAGLALSPSGLVSSLPATVEVALSVDATTAISPEAGRFAPCGGAVSAPASARGMFVLVVGPALGYRERAPRRGLDARGAVEGCGSRFAVDGVRFRLEALPIDALEVESPSTVGAIRALGDPSDAPGRARLRNLLAHLCLGTEASGALARDPFRPGASSGDDEVYGPIDLLRANGQISECEVPLAALAWPAAGVTFLDIWSVRRRPLPRMLGIPWLLHVGARRRAETEAGFLQFQEQLESFQLAGSVANLRALDRFRFLPSAGYLPIATGQFTTQSFFDGLAVHEQSLDLGFVRGLFEDSWGIEPIDLDDPPPIRVLDPGGGAGFIVFVRDSDVPILTPPSEPDQPPPPTEVRPGRVDVYVDFGVRDAGFATRSPFLKRDVHQVEAAKRLGIDPLAITTKVDPKNLRVFAVDAFGKTHEGIPVRFGQRAKLGKLEITLQLGTAQFRINSLDPGDYTVYARAKGFKEASLKVTITSDVTSRLKFTLVADKGGGGRGPVVPPKDIPGRWIDPGWFGKGYIVDPYLGWPWPPRPDLTAKFVPVVDPPPPEVSDWVVQWGDRIRATNPDAPLDQGGIQIYIDKTYSPGTVTNEP